MEWRKTEETRVILNVLTGLWKPTLIGSVWLDDAAGGAASAAATLLVEDEC